MNDIHFEMLIKIKVAILEIRLNVCLGLFDIVIITIQNDLLFKDFIKLTEDSGIHKLSVSDLGEKFTMPMQLRRVSSTQATIVHSGCKAT